MKTKIIITGGCGYIGSHTAVELIESGFEVAILDDLSNSNEETLSNIYKITGITPAFIKVDLKNPEATTKAFEVHKDAVGVIHFAAHKAVGESVQKPLMYYKNNFYSLLNTLEAQSAFGINNLIFSSSATVYGTPNTLPITEGNKRQRPFSPYGNTKKIAEEILEDFTKVNPSFRAISLRYFNPIGAHSSGKLGEAPSGIPNNLMPFITQTAIGVREELKVFGNDYNTKDGTAIRDYLHVVDLAEAHVIALDRLLKKQAASNFELFNLGTGTGYSVIDVIKSFERTSGQKLNYSFSPRRDGDVPALFADATKANNELGWKAKLSLDTMTRSSWAWEKKIREK